MYFYLIFNNYLKLGPYGRFQVKLENSSNQKKGISDQNRFNQISKF